MLAENKKVEKAFAPAPAKAAKTPAKAPAAGAPAQKVEEAPRVYLEHSQKLADSLSASYNNDIQL